MGGEISLSGRFRLFENFLFLCLFFSLDHAIRALRDVRVLIALMRVLRGVGEALMRVLQEKEGRIVLTQALHANATIVPTQVRRGDVMIVPMQVRRANVTIVPMQALRGEDMIVLMQVLLGKERNPALLLVLRRESLRKVRMAVTTKFCVIARGASWKC